MTHCLYGNTILPIFNESSLAKNGIFILWPWPQKKDKSQVMIILPDYNNSRKHAGWVLLVKCPWKLNTDHPTLRRKREDGLISHGHTKPPISALNRRIVVALVKWLIFMTPFNGEKYFAPSKFLYSWQYAGWLVPCETSQSPAGHTFRSLYRVNEVRWWFEVTALPLCVLHVKDTTHSHIDSSSWMKIWPSPLTSGMIFFSWFLFCSLADYFFGEQSFLQNLPQTPISDIFRSSTSFRV